LDDITIRASSIDGKMLEINHMKAKKFLYVVENEQRNDTVRWHFYDIQALIQFIKNKKIPTTIEGRSGQNRFHVIKCKHIRNNGLMIQEGSTISDAKLLELDDLIDWNV